MNRIKKIVKKGLYHIWVYDALRYFQMNRVIILMYHRFSDRPEPFKIQKDVFEKQIIFLKKKYNFVSLSHYANVLTGKKYDLPPNPMILTIDDGYWDNYVYAYPVLKKYSIPATIFLTTDFISYGAWLWANKLEYILKNTKYRQFTFSLDGCTMHFDVSNFKNWHKTQLNIFNYCASIPNFEKDKLLAELAKDLKVDVPEQAVGDFTPLTWDQIREMYKNGVSFGSHTSSHPILSRLEQEEAKSEIVLSKKAIEENLGEEVTLFCYPNGRLDDFHTGTVNCLKNAGYGAAVTTVQGHNSLESDPFYLRRISISNENQEAILWTLVRA